jgi:glycosyltransferase 2 family protein
VIAAAWRRAQPWMPVLRVVGFVAGVGLIAVTAVAAARSTDLGSLDWPPIAAACVVATVWWLGLARLWALLVDGRWTARAAGMWVRTQALRYLPGGFWAPASRVAFGDGALPDRFAVVAAENIIALCAALAVGGVCLALAGDWGWAPLALAAIVPVVAARRLPTAVDAHRARAATVTATLAFVAYVACAALVQGGVSGFHESLATAGAAALAWGAGLVVVIAPGGLGVREIVFVALMDGRLPRGDLATGAVVTRLVTIVAELAVFLVLARPAGTSIAASVRRRRRAGTANPPRRTTPGQ